MARDARTVTVGPSYSEEPGQFHNVPRGPYPRADRQFHTEDDSAPINAAYVRRTIRDLKLAFDDMATLLTDQSHRVDEYRVQSLGGETTTTVVGQPDYKGSEIIESIIVTGPAATTIGGASNEGTVATPAINAIIVSVNVPVAGIYTIDWSVEVKGAAATLADNYKLTQSVLTLIANAVQPIAVGVYPQQKQVVYLPAGATVNIITLATEATATITGQITLTPYQGLVPFTLKLGNRVWSLALPQTGILVISPVKISLTESSTRQLTAALGGDWAFELMGITDSGRIGRPGSV